MRPVLGLLLVSFAASVAAAPAAPPAPPAPAAVPAPPAAAPKPDIAPPAPVPVERAPVATPPVHMRLPSQVFAPLISEPPVIEDESAVSAETIEWRDWLVAKQDRRIERGDEIGGLAAIGVRLGSRAQAGSIEGLTDEQAAALSAWNDDGALVISVMPGSPAERGGLMPGDVIVQFAGIWVDSTSLFVRLASRSAIGKEHELLVLRNGQVEPMYVTPMDRRELNP